MFGDVRPIVFGSSSRGVRLESGGKPRMGKPRRVSSAWSSLDDLIPLNVPNASTTDQSRSNFIVNSIGQNENGVSFLLHLNKTTHF